MHNFREKQHVAQHRHLPINIYIPKLLAEHIQQQNDFIFCISVYLSIYSIYYANNLAILFYFFSCVTVVVTFGAKISEA